MSSYRPRVHAGGPPQLRRHEYSRDRMGWARRRGYRESIMAAHITPAIVFAGIDNVPLGIDAGHRRLPALLERLASERIMLVFCSFRARAEIEGFRQSVGVFHPFVCENGSAVFTPRHYFGTELMDARQVAGYDTLEFGLPYDHVVEIIRSTARQLRVEVRGFADMSIEQVAAETGLSLLDARLAKLREYGEPFRLVRPDAMAERRVIRFLESYGLACERHGGFHHAASAAGPAAAVAVLATLYRTVFGRIVTAAAGEAATASIMARVDVALDTAAASGRRGPGETVAWMENIADQIASFRTVRSACPA
jgi:mannosyl-3-phosphoglycerate phosphatase